MDTPITLREPDLTKEEPSATSNYTLRKLAEHISEDFECVPSCEADVEGPGGTRHCPCAGDDCWRCAALMALANDRAGADARAAPIPMVLHCPECRTRHVDIGEFATKVHHTHSCQGCGLTWRPAVVATVGVQFLPGFKNEAAPDDCPCGDGTRPGHPLDGWCGGGRARRESVSAAPATCGLPTSVPYGSPAPCALSPRHAGECNAIKSAPRTDGFVDDGIKVEPSEMAKGRPLNAVTSAPPPTATEVPPVLRRLSPEEFAAAPVLSDTAIADAVAKGEHDRRLAMGATEVPGAGLGGPRAGDVWRYTHSGHGGVAEWTVTGRRDAAGRVVANNGNRDGRFHPADFTDGTLTLVRRGPPEEGEGTRAEVERLKALLHRDKTGLAKALEDVMKRAQGAGWIAEGRGSYAWDDDDYRKETGWLVRDIMSIARSALEASGSLVNEAFHGAPQLSQPLPEEQGQREAPPSAPQRGSPSDRAQPSNA